MAYGARVLKDSLSLTGVRLTTIEVTFPRIVLAEFNTHRMFSRNSASSRAIPVEKRIRSVLQDPFVPEAFGQNQKGMQADQQLTGWANSLARYVWMLAMYVAVALAWCMTKLQVHKQLANRLIEPFCWQTVICTATEWDNFWALRCSKDAQPEIRKAAELMRSAYYGSLPRLHSEWHLPLTDDFDDLVDAWHEGKLGGNMDLWEALCLISCGRCARVSYLTHNGRRDPQADIDLALRLKQAGHMSPFEHVARPLTADDVVEQLQQFAGVNSFDRLDIDPKEHFSGNFRGWQQYRKTIRHEDNFMKAQEAA